MYGHWFLFLLFTVNWKIGPSCLKKIFITTRKRVEIWRKNYARKWRQEWGLASSPMWLLPAVNLNLSTGVVLRMANSWPLKSPGWRLVGWLVCGRVFGLCKWYCKHENEVVLSHQIYVLKCLKQFILSFSTLSLRKDLELLPRLPHLSECLAKTFGKWGIAQSIYATKVNILSQVLSPNFVNMYHCYNLSWVVLIDFTSGAHCHCSVLVHMRCRCVDPSLLRPVRLPSCQACLINTTWQRSLLTSLCKASVILCYHSIQFGSSPTWFFHIHDCCFTVLLSSEEIVNFNFFLLRFDWTE